MLDRMLRAPMQFFIRTRAGSIIQRFSGDLVSTSLTSNPEVRVHQQDMVIPCAELVGQTTMQLGKGRDGPHPVAMRS